MTTTRPDLPSTGPSAGSALEGLDHTALLAVVASHMQTGLHVYRLDDPADDRSLRLVTANAAAAAMTGLSHAEAVGKTLDELFPSQRAQGIPQAYAEVARGGVPIEREHVAYGADLVLRDAFSVKAFPLPGRCVGVTFENITARRRAEAELRARDARESVLFQSSPVIVYTCAIQPPYTTTFMSPNVKDHFGWDAARFLEDPGFWSSKVHPDDLQRVVALLERLLETGRVFNDYRFQRADGTWVWVQDEVRIAFDADGRPRELIGFWADATPRRNLESALRLHAERTAAMLKAILDLVFRVDVDGTLTDFHAQDPAQLFVPAGEIVGRRVDELLPPDVAVPAMAGIRAACAQPGQLQVLHYALRTDRERYWEARIVAPSSREAYVIVRDVTSWKDHETQIVEAQLQAQAASRAKSSFLANMSHELRTPLNGIIGFSELLQQEHFGPLNERQRRYVDNVLASGKHLLQLVNDVLDLSKVEAGRLVLSCERLPFGAIADTVRGIVQPLADRAGVALELNVPADLPPIFADGVRLKQILYNLLSNAVKFTPRGGRICLRANAAGADLRIEVEDSGVGIRAEDLPRLFREFEQIENLRGAKPEGTGLGLALTKRLVELHGGTVSAESEPGKGSVFRVDLPREPRLPGDDGARREGVE